MLRYCSLFPCLAMLLMDCCPPRQMLLLAAAIGLRSLLPWKSYCHVPQRSLNQNSHKCCATTLCVLYMYTLVWSAHNLVGQLLWESRFKVVLTLLASTNSRLSLYFPVPCLVDAVDLFAPPAVLSVDLVLHSPVSRGLRTLKHQWDTIDERVEGRALRRLREVRLWLWLINDRCVQMLHGGEERS